MIRKATLSALLIAWLPAVTHGDIDRDDPSAYGIGILTCPYATFMLSAACFNDLSWLREPVDVYEEPRDDATVVGSILDPDEELQGWQPFHFRSSNNTVTELGIVEVGYEEKAVVIYEQTESWLRTGQGWLNKRDVRLDANTVFLTWDTVFGYQMTGILEDGKPYVGWFYPLADQVLYDSPEGDAMGSIQNVSVDGRRPELLVLNRQGDWIEVTVDTLGTTCNSQHTEPDGPTGWIRLTSDRGNPLVYWYTRGC